MVTKNDTMWMLTVAQPIPLYTFSGRPKCLEGKNRKKSIKSALERPKGEKNRVFGLKNPKKLPNFCCLYEKITLHS
jgi:hypothetical protein